MKGKGYFFNMNIYFFIITIIMIVVLSILVLWSECIDVGLHFVAWLAFRNQHSNLGELFCGEALIIIRLRFEEVFIQRGRYLRGQSLEEKQCM